ncbi:MAG: hypothetical protein H6737_03370 [Alphaproteobacteria bacterium]|nr:hypothetical protein [Alphaproteobacteria bacterium]
MLTLLSIALAADPEADLVRPTYSWVHVSEVVYRKRPDDALERRRAVEARLEKAGGQRRVRLLRESADLLVAASDAVWVAELRRLDSAWALGEDAALDTEAADALRDEALRRYESAIEAGGAGLAGARLAAGLLRRERRELDAARVHLAGVVEGPAPRRLRRAAAVELGEMEFEAGDVALALEAYEAAATWPGPDDLEAYAAYRIAWCQFNLGEFRSATGNLVRAARTSRDRALAEEARRDAVRFAARLDVREALEVVEEVCDDDACVVDRRAELAAALDENGRIRAAAEVRSLEP